MAMYPVKASLWERLDVFVDLGVSWDKGSAVGKYLSGPDRIRRAAPRVYHPAKRFHALFGSLENNNGLGVDLRALAGAGYGTKPIRTQRSRLSFSAGRRSKTGVGSGIVSVAPGTLPVDWAAVLQTLRRDEHEYDFF
jgi:hypothetical protein